MIERPSLALLKLLRDAALRKGMDALAVSAETDIPSERVEAILAGDEPITVDEFIAMALGLEMGLEDLGGQVVGLSVMEDHAGLPGGPAGIGDLGEAVSAVADRDGNHAAQIVQLGFALGCDVFFMADATRLDGAGFPDKILARFPEQLPIRLDAAFHKHMAPRYDPEGLTLALSFGALYTCTIPWDAFIQVTLFPHHVPTTVEPPPEEPEQGRGHLRLVE